MDNNSAIAKIFRDIAKILEIKGENIFRIRAYEKAAENIESLGTDIEEFAQEKNLTQIPGIGKDLAQKINEYLSSGRIHTYEELKQSIPQGLLELLDVPSIGPKTAKLLYDNLKIENVQQLKDAIAQGRLVGLPGIKEKTIENIRRGLQLYAGKKERMTLAQAKAVAVEFIQGLKKVEGVKKIEVAGSLRRQKETVRDIDLLLLCDSPKVMQEFTRLPMVKEILACGSSKSSVRTHEGVQVDCRIVPAKSFGAALLYFTGSKNFNIKLRQLAQKMKLKINEYGVFRQRKWLAGRSEEEMFKVLNMDYIFPELREDTGEVELALEHRLPLLVEARDIRGDFHVHSRWSDGTNEISQIATYAQNLGYSFVCVADHSQGLRVANGLSVNRLKDKKKEITSINKRLANFRVLFGSEVDIDSEGRLDYPNDILSEFDIVIAAIHSGFKQTKGQLTKRIISACKNKYVRIIAHPTGRLFGLRDSYDLDWPEIFKACVDNNTALEINAYPTRLDISDQICRRAKEMKVKMALGTDAHNLSEMENMQLGLAQARRGWLSKDDLLNSLSIEELL